MKIINQDEKRHLIEIGNLKLADCFIQPLGTSVYMVIFINEKEQTVDVMDLQSAHMCKVKQSELVYKVDCTLYYELDRGVIDEDE